MNSLQIAIAQDSAQPDAPAPLPAPTPPPQPPRHAQPPKRRAKGKIGQLPKQLRDQLNFLIQDGVPYAQILARLGDATQHITPRDISRWHQSAHYQRWVLDQDWLEHLRQDQEPGFGIMDDFDAAKFDQASLQLAVTRLFLALRHCDSGDLNQYLGGNAQAFARLVHALARACHVSSNVKKSAEAAAIQQALENKDIKRDLSDNEYGLLINRMDQVFRVGRRPLQPAAPQSKPSTPAPPPPSPTAPKAA